MKHVGHQVAARPSHLINDHYLWTPNSRGRAGERITIAGNIVKVPVKVSLQHIDDVVSRRATAVVSLVYDRAFLVLLREVITIETGVARLARIRQIDIGQLAIGKFLNQPTI